MAKATFGPQKIADERFVERTGRSMREWTTILDRWRAKAKGHTATARYLEKARGVDGWWAQAITVAYEYARGLRRPLTIPADLRKALAGAKKAKAAFEGMSLSHKREYVQWITEAKRPETRARRVHETIDRLAASSDPRRSR